MFNRQHNKLYFSFLLLFTIISGGTCGYIVLEDYNFVEAFYMTVITISTTGFQEVRALSSNGRLFTAFLIIFSFSTFAYVISAITQYVIDGDFKKHLKLIRLEKKIAKLNNHVVVCGFGRNGNQATMDLLSHNETVLVIEKTDDLICEKAEQFKNLHYINGDATSDEIQLKARLYAAKALITTLPSDADNLFIVLSAREQNSSMTIISRASDDHSDRKLNT